MIRYGESTIAGTDDCGRIGRQVRTIYMDEAGTSANEPVAVVVGIIVHTTQEPPARRMIRRALSHVPVELREGFVFHATEIWNSHALRRAMTVAQRESLMSDMLSIPRTAGGLSIAYSAARKDCTEGASGLPYTKAQQAHIIAFLNCLEIIDEFMDRIAFPGETATIVAEDVREIRQTLQGFCGVLQREEGGGPRLGARWEYPPSVEGEPSITELSGNSKLTRIVGTPRFVAKDEEPLLQVADACAFALRRFFSRLNHGRRLLTTILGTEKTLDRFEHFDTPACNSVILMIPPHLKRSDVETPYVG